MKITLTPQKLKELNRKGKTFLDCSDFIEIEVEQEPLDPCTDPESTEAKMGRYLPEDGEEYFFTRIGALIREEISYLLWDNRGIHEIARKYCNCFPSREAAEMELLRREWRGKCWTPKVGEDYYWWSFSCEEALQFVKAMKTDIIECLLLGNSFKTKQEAEDWGKSKYADAWRYLLPKQ